MKYLTSVMRGEHTEEIPILCGDGCQELTQKEVGAKERLKAAELIGKRYGMFTDKVGVEGAVPATIGSIIKNTVSMVKSEGSNVQTVGRIDIEKYRCITDEIATDEVIITPERIQHIEERHPGDYEQFVKYVADILENPDYILEANKPNTGVILKEIEENGEKFKVILRVKVESDPAEYRNSILSFWQIGETTWKKNVKNKKILYKRE